MLELKIFELAGRTDANSANKYLIKDRQQEVTRWRLTNNPMIMLFYLVGQVYLKSPFFSLFRRQLGLFQRGRDPP